MAHGPRKKPLDSDGDQHRVTLRLGLGWGQSYGYGGRETDRTKYSATMDACRPASVQL